MDKTTFLQGLIKELSTSANFTPGTGEQYAGKKYNGGLTKAPSIPNRPSKAFDYKELWTDDYTTEAIGDDKEWVAIFSKGNERKIIYVKASDKVKAEREAWISSKLSSTDNWDLIRLAKPAMRETVKEGYASFRNETKTRTKPEQFHQAVKAVKTKVNEINRLFEYMNRLQLELSEGDSGFKYKRYTERAMQVIRETVKELYIKSKKLK